MFSAFADTYLFIFRSKETAQIFFRVAEDSERVLASVPEDCYLVGNIYLTKKELLCLAAVISCDHFDVFCGFLESAIAFLLEKEKEQRLVLWNLSMLGIGDPKDHFPDTLEGGVLGRLFSENHLIILSTNYLLAEVKKVLFPSAPTTSAS